MKPARFTLDDLLDAVRRYTADNLPGKRPARLCIDLDDGEKVRHPVPVANVIRGRQQEETRPAADPPPPPEPPFRFSDDYKTCWWGGEEFSFSCRQAAAMKILHESYQKGVPGLGQQYILEEIDSDCRRLRDLFRGRESGGERMHAAWGSLIVQTAGGRGMFTLAEPD